MADLTYDADLRFKGEPHTEFFPCHTGSAQTIYKGQPLVFTSTDTSHAIAFVTAVNIAATDVCIGIAAEHKTVVSGAVEANTLIEVYVSPSIVGFKSTAFTTNDSLGDIVYASDSGTLNATHSDNPELGTLYLIEDGYCYVKLSSPRICLLADT
jgi:hypothetical protein